MDDDDEDFEALFFTECEELLADLQEHLDQLLAGEGDIETLNAAFRAVHSVKGGAAAFGFDTLISFAHVFETVMDRGRSDEIELTPDVCQTMLRAGDVMEILIEKARERDETAPENMEKVLAELNLLSDLDASEQATASEAPASDPEPVAEEEPEEEVEMLRSVHVHFIPDAGFFRAGHDALKLIESAKPMGLSGVEVVGEIPPLGEFFLDECPVSWKLNFETELELERFEEFFMVYEAAAKWEINEEAPVEVEQDEVAKEAKPQAKPAEKPPAQAAPAP